MHSIDIYIDDEQQRKRRRGKWLIPLIVGVSAALAVGGEKPTAPPQPTPFVIPPREVVRPQSEPVVELLPVPTQTLPTPPPLPGRIAVAPVRLDFGDGPLTRGVPAQMTTIRNEGEQPLPRVSAVVDGPFLATSGCPNELAPGDQCMIAVVFSPRQPGRFAGTLKIAAGGERVQVQLRGSVPRPRPVDTPRGPDPVTSSAAAEIVPPPGPIPAPPKPPDARTLCFDPPLVRFTSTGRQTITLMNPEPTPIRVVGILPIGGQGRTVSGYEIESRKCLRALKARQQCKFTVRATELAIQARETMQLTVYYDDPVSGGTRAARTISACGGR